MINNLLCKNYDYIIGLEMGSKLQWNLIFKLTFSESISMWSKTNIILCLTQAGFRPRWNIVSTLKVTTHIPWRAGHSSVPHLSTASDKSKHVTSVQNPSGAKHSMEYIFNQLICEWPKGLSQWQTAGTRELIYLTQIEGIERNTGVHHRSFFTPVRRPYDLTLGSISQIKSKWD